MVIIIDEAHKYVNAHYLLSEYHIGYLKMAK